jgi:hypothetical protein
MAVNYNVVVYDVTPYSLMGGTKVLEQPAASIFGVGGFYMIDI